MHILYRGENQIEMNHFIFEKDERIQRKWDSEAKIINSKNRDDRAIFNSIVSGNCQVSIILKLHHINLLLLFHKQTPIYTKTGHHPRE